MLHRSALDIQASPLAVRDACHRLGIDRLVLAIHQASFPAADDDIGHGSPHSSRAADLFALAAGLGFTGIMLGPSGVTSEENASPYDGSALSRNPLHIAFAELAGSPFGGLVDPALLDAAIAGGGGDRVRYREAWRAQRRLLASATATLRTGGDAHQGVVAHLAAARSRWSWLAREARYEAIAAAVGHDDWARWPAAPPLDAGAGERFVLEQVIVHQQHAALQVRLGQLGLRLYGDLAIGTSHRDRWQRDALFLPGYAMGAPPSRTNPEGQPWGYPVLDPAQLAAGGPARAFLEERIGKLIDEHDGVRIDHPHGWICPWVYRTDVADVADAGVAVRSGARLFESPDLSDHPALARFARVDPEQLDRGRPRHDDGWVRELRPEQIDRYAAIIDLIVERGRALGRVAADLVIEVLSTCPRPLAAVLARHGLGRFRVTQKANVVDSGDCYRSDRAAPADWIMVGNHDTAPLARVVDGWAARGELAARAAYLSGRLTTTSGRRAALAAELERGGGAMATAMVADLFAGPARHVQIFWPDLFGMREVYNLPGVVDGQNWSMRVPPAFETALAEATRRGEAPRLGSALALALEGRGLDQGDEGRALVAALRAPGRA
jgi:4-alpha-glucanotransferase